MRFAVLAAAAATVPGELVASRHRYPTLGAYVGVSHDGTWTLAAFDQSAVAGHGTSPTDRDTCTNLRAISPCDTYAGNLCIECVGRTAADQCTP